MSLSEESELRMEPQQPNKSGYQVSIGAGGVIFRRSSGRECEIFFVKNAYGRWTFPKGKQQLGDSLVETAIREIKEEVGLDGLTFIAPLGRTTFRFRREGALIQKIVYFFLFEAPIGAKEHLTGVEAMWESQWVPISKAIQMNGYQNLDRVLVKAIRLIDRK